MHIRSLEDLCIENCFDFFTKLFDNSPDPKSYIFDISLPERPSQKMLERLLISKNHSNLLRHFSPLISTISNICLDKSAHHIDGTNGKEFDFSVLSSRLSSIALKSNRRRSGAVGQDGGPHYIPTPSETGRLLLFFSSFSRSDSQDPFPTIGPAQVSHRRRGAPS